MNLKNIIKAFFTRKNEQVSLELSAAEIKEGRAWLHPKEDRSITYLVHSNDIEVYLSKGKSLDDEDIIILKRKPADEDEGTPPDPPEPENDDEQPSPESPASNSHTPDRYKKKKFTVSLYQDEYDKVIASMKSYGYKRGDFVLACVNTATKGTMEGKHKKIVRTHDEIRKEQKSMKEKQK